MIFPESPVRDLYRVIVWGPYRKILVQLPRSWELRLSRKLGKTAAFVAGQDRVETNLKRAFPTGLDYKQVAQEAFGTHFANQYLPFAFPRISPDTWQDYLEIKGQDLLDKALTKGRGVVLMHPHMGPVQLPLAVFGTLGYNVHQVGGGKVIGLSKIGEWAASKRASLEKHMNVTIHDGQGFLRPVLRALSDGAVVMATCDGTGGGEEIGRRVVRSVLGFKMRLPVGPVYLALKSGAPLLTLVTHRKNNGYITEIGKEIVLERHLPLKKALEDGADKTADFLQSVLKKYPSDWHFWDHFEPGKFLED